MAKDYSEYQDNDRHQNSRDKKREKRKDQKAMQGNRSVFVIQETKMRRDRRNMKRFPDERSD